jgi:hypothetical protein
VTLEEILDHLAHNVLDDRADLVSGPPDSLWSDETLVRYLNKGVELFCRKAWAIEDDDIGTDLVPSPCCVIPLQENINRYALHKSVLRVLSCTPADTDIPLLWISFDLIVPRPQVTLPDYYVLPPVPMVEAATRPGWYSTDNATRILRIRPAPDAANTASIKQLNLRVARLPLVPLTVEDTQAEPAIPEEYHLDLCNYAAGMALMQANVDSEAKDEGAKWVQKYLDDLRSARNDRLKAQMAPGIYVHGTTTRTPRY